MNWSRIIATTIAFSSSLPVLADTAPAIDFGKVNSQIQQVINQTFQADELIEKVTFRINSQNASLDPIRVQLEASATTKTSPWARNEKTVLQVSAKAHSQEIQPNGQTTVGVTFRVGLQTQAIRLVNFLATKALNSFGRDSSQPGAERGRAAIVSLSQAKTLGEVASALNEFKAALDEAWAHEGEDSNSGDWFFAKKLHIQAETVNGSTRSISIVYDSFFNDELLLKGFRLTLKETGISVNLDLDAKFRSRDLVNLRNKFIEDLQAIEAGTTEAIRNVSSMISGIAEMAKELAKDKF